ncbi:MAG: HAMP domain-containing histidine kinase [Phycisphaeraceae bacterium]|nr:MAG: HAMP domain-containing histidine kinase [Phycisphaeraceae bacterium]
MAAGISLANKSQLLFGFAVVAILGVALSVPWFYTAKMVEDDQQEIMRHLADAWLRGQIHLGRVEQPGAPPPRYSVEFDEPVRMTFVAVEAVDESPAGEESFSQRALARFRQDDTRTEYMTATRLANRDVYHYARAIRESDMRRLRDRTFAEFEPGAADDAVANRLRAMLIIDRRSDFAGGQLLVMRIYIITAWLAAGLLAILLFYFILTKLILSPVRKLRASAEKVEAGDTSIRADIRTGDEFEQLAKAFNGMLERLAEGQQQLRSINETLDLRLSELAEANFALYESNRLKGEFLASVSHELRTPLNSIIGFSELLDELARNDPQADPKRRRYITNILNSARALLEMINDLLEMAKIEAGRVELNIAPASVTDLVEGLQTLMRPQAQRRNIMLETRCAPNLPAIETDAGKLQQILYNFLSNAIKFSPEGETVIIAAERVTRAEGAPGVRLSVIDRGPGIPRDMQDIIFEKFRQVDASHTRTHQGVGLGLAICRELAELLGASLSLVSELGQGSTFSVEVPLAYEPPKPRPLMEPVKP